MVSNSYSVIVRVVHTTFIIIFLIVKIYKYIPLFWNQFKMRNRCRMKINEKNKISFLDKGKNWHKLYNKSISMVLTNFRSGVKKNDLDSSYTLKIKKDGSILEVIHELAHIKNGDCEEHLNNSLSFAISLAWSYITIFEPRAIQAEIDYFEQQRGI